MYDDNSLIETIRKHTDEAARRAELHGAGWHAWAELLGDVLDKMPSVYAVWEMDECGEQSWLDTGAEHIDTSAMRRDLEVMRSNADAIAAAYQRTGKKVTDRAERRLAELAEDFAVAEES